MDNKKRSHTHRHCRQYLSVFKFMYKKDRFLPIYNQQENVRFAGNYSPNLHDTY